MTSKPYIKVIVAVAIIAVGIAGYFLAKRQGATEKPITIGVLSILSGDAAAWGEAAKKGIDLALEEWREANPNKTLELIYEDTAAETKKTVSSFQKLVEIDKVDAILGPLLQTEIAAVAPLINKYSIPVIAPSYAPVENRPNLRNPLLIWMNVTKEAEYMAEFVYARGIKSVAAIGTKDAWESEVTNVFADRFSALGGRVLYKELAQPDANDIKSTWTKALAEKPEAIFIGTYYQFINSLKALADLGYKGKLFSIEVDNYLASQTKGAADGLQFIAPDFYTSDFATKFENRYHEKPGIPAGQAYDAANILLKFLESGEPKEAILEKMRQIKEYDGASGLIKFTADGKTLLPTAIFDLQDGNIVKIQNQ